jgi:hypothetical protein
MEAKDKVRYVFVRDLSMDWQHWTKFERLSAVVAAALPVLALCNFFPIPQIP